MIEVRIPARASNVEASRIFRDAGIPVRVTPRFTHSGRYGPRIEFIGPGRLSTTTDMNTGELIARWCEKEES